MPTGGVRNINRGVNNSRWFLPPLLRFRTYPQRDNSHDDLSAEKVSDVDNDVVVSPTAAARLVGLSVATLAKLRVTGGGPAYIKAGRKVLYCKRDLIGWLDARRVRSTTEAAGLPRRLTDPLVRP